MIRIVQNAHLLAGLVGYFAILAIFNHLAFCRSETDVDMMFACPLPDNNTIRTNGGFDEFTPVLYALVTK